MSGSTISREMTLSDLDCDDAELNRLIATKAILAPIINESGKERFYIGELRNYLESQRRRRTA